MASEGAAVRKRQQIAQANRMMFLWVAGVSVIVGASVVLSIFLFQKAMFNEKVLAEKSKTADTLIKNNEVAGDLQEQIRVINTDEDLKEVAVGGSEPIQAVLDALPSTANSSGFGASLQRRFLSANGLTLESLNVDPVPEVEVGSGLAPVAGGDPSEYVINFRFSVRASNPSTLKRLLVSLERSIRPISLTRVDLEAQGSGMLLSVTGNTYFQPAQTVELKDKAVSP